VPPLPTKIIGIGIPAPLTSLTEITAGKSSGVGSIYLISSETKAYSIVACS